ncbi:MAG: hypothetical protein JWO03_1000 [Bacteroidetes bacterium]|nr:hypothetical protein [Bacteroidota bacterium]
MNVLFSDIASEKMLDIAEFIDNINSPGAGDRWIEKFVDYIAEYARLNHVQWPLCRNKNLEAKSYSCLIYKNWVIAFKIEENEFRVYDLIYGSLLE